MEAPWIFHIPSIGQLLRSRSNEQAGSPGAGALPGSPTHSSFRRYLALSSEIRERRRLEGRAAPSPPVVANILSRCGALTGTNDIIEAVGRERNGSLTIEPTAGRKMARFFATTSSCLLAPSDAQRHGRVAPQRIFVRSHYTSLVTGSGWIYAGVWGTLVFVLTEEKKQLTSISAAASLQVPP